MQNLKRKYVLRGGITPKSRKRNQPLGVHNSTKGTATAGFFFAIIILYLPEWGFCIV